MFRLAHISDLHLSPLPKIRIAELFSKRMTGYINWQKHRRFFHHTSSLNQLICAINNLNPDHLAITGDLVNLATCAEIINAEKWLSENCPPHSTSFVPGNHDAYVPGAFKKAMESWQPWLSGDQAHSSHYFPYMHVRGPVAIIGLSTSNATMPFYATGNFTKRQADEALRLLEQAKKQNLCRIILIHHPPYHGATHFMKRMRGIKTFNTMIKNSGAELVLHGHTHLNTRYDLKSGAGHIPIIGIASASQISGDKKPVAGFNLFDISNKNGGISCIHNRYALEQSGHKAKLIEKVRLF